MQNRRHLAALAATLAVAGCFQAPSSKSKTTEQKGQFGVFYIVNVSRPVGGSIQSTDGQVNCGTAGSGRDACGPAQYSWTTVATFNAVADAGQVFQSWAGDCGGQGSCSLDTVSSGADKYLVAVFNPPDRLGHPSIPDPAQHGPLFFAFVKKTPNTPKCNTCHGPTYTGLGNAPSCTACHAQAGFPDWLNNCNFCHTNPPAAPHVQANNCSACHTGYGDKGGTGTQVTNAATHMNGVADVSGAACTACHGTPGVNAAPPVDLAGNSTTTSISVGAHQAHLVTTRSKAVACAECHVVPTDMGHVTNPPANRVAFGALANQGVTAAWSAGSATCTTYCHGGSAALAGGTGTTPVWTQVNGTFSACTSCHGAPPPSPHPQNAVCGTCHTGYTINSTAPATHVNGVVDVRPLTCTSCHGTEGRTGADPYIAAAPPVGTAGETQTTSAAVGAHQAHLNAGPIARAFACTDCHTPPTSTSHATGTTTFSFSVLAGGSAVRYDAATATCSNVYCHGNFAGGIPANAPSWTAGAAGRACGSCHGVPPPAPHSQSLACGNCHVGYSGSSVNLINHVNGAVDVVPLSCTSCHGTTGVNAAPPLDTAGGSGTAFVSVGAHQAHVTTGLMAQPIACSECHGAAAASYGMGHADGTVQVSFGSTANNGTSTVWTRGTASCAASYCHGGTTAIAGGTGETPVWTVVNGTFKTCTSCHGAPPPAPHPQNGSCGSCHTGYTATTVNASLHINRTVDVAALSCTSCHGTAGANGAPPVDTTGGTSTGLVSVGAHQAHVASTLSAAIACSQCHGAAADAYTTTHADSTVQVLFGALANQGTSTTWTRGTASCAASYCHGGTSAVAGGTATTPVWTTVNGVFKACTACHGNPPALSASTHHPSNANCSACHGTGYSASTVAAATHVNGTLNVTRTGCTSCHGDLSTTGVANTSVLAAPGASAGSADTAGNTVATSAGVGAHAAHLTGTRLRATPIDCVECHAVPAAGDVAHATGTGTGGARATVAFGTLALTGGIGNAGYAGSATGAGGSTAGTCSNVYCHGNFTGSGVTSSLSWTGGPAAAAGCASCHGAPPPAPHSTSTACGSCHAGYTSTTVNASTHLNGTVDVASLSCTSCHGGVNPAPPVDTTGGSATTLVSVGAHQAHVAPTVRAAIACSECHGAASATYTNTHSDATVQVAFGALANQGTTTTWTRGSASCAASYCHGGTSAVAGGTGTTPVWTTVDGSYKACTACHGNPPALSATTHHPVNANCASCHGAGYSNSAIAGAALATHVDGTVNKPANGCTACHGVLAGAAGAAVASTSATAAPGFNASAVDTAGNTGATFAGIGAHQAHLTGTRWRSTAIACSECHTVPASADVAHATGTGTGGARATMTFGTLAKTGLGTTASYAGSATAAGGSTAGTCSNVYCHGAFTGSGVTAAVSWTGGAAAANCGTCHGAPPPAPHSQSTACGSCHAGYTASTVNVTAHLNGTVDVQSLSCTSCHGSVNAAPPVDTTGGSATTLVTVGAHQAHVTTALMAQPVACSECHGTAAASYDNSHTDGTVQVAFGALANQGTTTVWTRGTGSCAASYCHGGTAAVAGGTGTTPVWTKVDGTYRACNACHGAPPPAPHAQSTACGSCHADYTSTSVNAAAHLNGAVDVQALSCTSCHGSVNPAPPVDTAGRSATTLVSVGAHQSHVASTLRPAMACTECHGAASAGYTNTHTDGTVQVAFGALSNQGTATTWSAGSASCAASYCHGGSSALAGGSGTTPVWTTVNGTYKACTACHGDPPPAPHVQNTTCSDCHTGYTNTSVAASTHVNGALNVKALDCSSCHGDAARTGADPYIAAMPPRGTAGETLTSQAAVGAHVAHLTDGALAKAFACVDCHNPPATNDHANGTVEFSWSVLAGSGAAVKPAYDFQTNSCSATYCHGNFTGGNAANAPVWTAGSAAVACGSCHGAPPAAPHSQSTACGSCHAGYTVTTVNVATHVNGIVEVNGLGCTSCHGGATNPAPPLDTTGGSATTLVSVGAHQAHVASTLRPAMSCTECHGAASAGYDTNHTDGVVQIAFGTLSNTGTTTVWTRGSASCAASYCHGGTAAVAGGTGTTPVWTTVNGTYRACTSCHGNPPALSAATHHPANASCSSCHGAGYSSSTVSVGTHVDGTVQKPASGCTACHGVLAGAGGAAVASGSATAAPGYGPTAVDTTGTTAASNAGVGAHAAHLTGTRWRAAPIDCAECHAVPADGDVTHATGTGSGGARATLTFGALARTGGISTAAYAGSATAAGGTAAGTCSNVYCHGNFTGSGVTSSLSWTGGASAAACGTCHGNPPPAPHTTNTSCGSCHTGYSSTAVNAALHLNGVVDVANLSCTSCHGGVNAAPPVDTTGGSATTLVSVGAHQAHVASTLRTPIACTECHGAASASYANDHTDGTVQVAFGALANTGTTTVWTRGTASCAASYCHGGTSAVAGGTGTTPVWTTVNGTYKACTSCHGNPPALNATTHHPANAACANCHGTGYTNAAVTGAALGTHVDGTVNKPANGCTACHGVLAGAAGAAVANTSATSAPGFNASAVDTAGNTAATFAGVGAHLAHLTGTRWRSTAIACNECHTVPASADVAHATGTGTGGARATMTFGTLAKAGLGTTAAYAGSATAAGGSTAGTCSNVYCHGAFTGSGVTASLSWTGGTAAASCGTCHGNPPPAPHVQNTTCSSCHTGYTNTSVNAVAHLNGTVDVVTMTCSSCHGTTGRTGTDPNIAAMPPTGTSGETLTSQAAVGAHVKHLTGGTISRAFACTDCHNPPTSTTHATGTTTFSWSVLAGAGSPSAPAYDAGAATCSNIYCHGNFTGGATANAPSWTAGPAAAACGSCHGLPPAAPHVQNTACGNCHVGYTVSSVNLTSHVNGVNDVTLSCTSCHGTPGRSSVAGADVQQASAPPAVASASGVAGVHLAHVNQGATGSPLSAPLACSNCHVVPASNAHGDSVIAVAWSGIAATGVTPPAYNLTNHTCASTYCHGNFTGGNQSATALSWSTAGKLGCTACHGNPPATATTHHPSNATCASCHTGYTNASVTASTHVDGTIQKPASGCTACHGVLAGQAGAAVAATSPTVAPGYSASAVDSAGSSATTSRGVGAHFRHLTPTLRSTALACTDCHPAVATGDTAHANGSVALAWGALASTNGSAPTTAVTAGTLSCSATWCHGGNAGLSGATAATIAWNANATVNCTSCHGNPPTGLGHPNNTACATCHGAGYVYTGATTGTISGAALATHVNGTVNLVAAESCTSCHGTAGRATGGIAGATYDANQASAPPADSRGSATGVLVGAHLAHVNPVASTIVGGDAQPTGGIMHPIACTECHPNNTGFQHGNGAVNMTFAAATGANLGGWTTTFVQGNGSTATTCATYCHGASLGTSYQGTATNPAWNGAAATCSSCHGFPPSTSGHNGVSSLSTACAGCHSATVNADGTIDVAGGHHIDGVQDVVKGNGCSGCHDVAADMKLAGTYQHVMAQDPGAAYPVDNATPIADADRNCNVCHMKHEFPNAATNLRNTINSATPTASSTDAALCTSCHEQNQMTKDATRQKGDGTVQTPLIDSAAFAASGHAYTVQGSFGASNFTVACVKCHNSDAPGTIQTGANKFALHTSPDRRLRAPLGRATLTDDDSANFCYRCHSAAADAIGGTRKLATANDWYGAVTTMPAGATNVFTQMQKGTAGTPAGQPTTATNTLYFKPSAAETPSGTLPTAHLSTTDTFAGGTFVARSMSPYTTTTAYESQTTTAATVATGTQNWRRVSFVSPTVATGFTTSAAAWTLNVWDRESSANANARVRYAIYTIDTAGALKASIVARANGGTEMGTTAAPGTQQTITTAAGAAVAVAAGDRIVVDLEIQTLSVTTGGSYSTTYFFGSGAASNVVMPNTVTFNYTSQGVAAVGRHDVAQYTGKHKPNPAEEHLQYIAANKHVDCSDCHDAHRAKRGNQGDAGTVTAAATGCTNSTTTLCDSTASWPVDAWKGYYLDTYTISNGANVSRAQITGNTANQLSVLPAITTPVASTVGYRIRMTANGGAVTAATTTTLTDAGTIGGTKAWQANAFAGWYVQIVYGTGMGQAALIASNTANQVTISGTWATTPTTTSRYMITRMPNVMLGTSGVNVTAWGIGSPTSWGEGKTFNPAAGSATALPDATAQWQVCFKCHSSANTSLATWKSTWTDAAQDFNPRNQSYHPVLAPAGAVAATGYGNTTIVGTLYNGWRTGDVMTCSDCHGNDDQATGASHGPHASAVAFILKGPNAYWPFQSNGTTRWTPGNAAAGLFCRNCHSGLSSVHTADTQHSSQACTACHIRIPHGGKVKRLIRTTNTPAPYADTGVSAVLNSYAGGSSNGSTSCGATCTTRHALGTSTTNSW